jgi:hypothetical protein
MYILPWLVLLGMSIVSLFNCMSAIGCCYALLCQKRQVQQMFYLANQLNQIIIYAVNAATCLVVRSSGVNV